MVNNRDLGKGKAKEENGQWSRPVLGDIGNFEGFRKIEVNQISHPITRNFHTKLLANQQCSANQVQAIEFQANKQGATQGKKNLIIPALDNKAIVHQKYGAEDLTYQANPDVDVVRSEAGKKINFVGERKSRGRSCRMVKTSTSVTTAGSKATRGILIEPEDESVGMGVNDAGELGVDEYLDDIYKFHKLTEDDYQVSDYMKSQHEINEKMRSIAVDWLVDVHMRFKFAPETLFLTVSILDRYLSVTSVSKEELQLVGIVSMLIACKYEEICSPQVKDFISIGDSAYTKNQILAMERAILKRLNWHLSVPTPYIFLVRFIRASGQPDQQMENMVFFLAELGLVHYQTAILYCPSMTAAAAVYVARCTLRIRPFWTEFLMLKAGYGIKQIRECAKLLVRLHTCAASDKLRAVFQKFSCLERGGVAFLCPPNDIEKHL